MFVRSLFVNSIIVLLMSIAPAKAQYSFMRVLGGDWEDWPKGMLQLSNGTFVVYGLADDFLSGTNYIANLGLWGDVNWEKYYSNTGGYAYYDCFQDQDGFIYACGSFELQAERNAGFTKLDIAGNILLDTAYWVNVGGSGGMLKVVKDDNRKIIASVGPGTAQSGGGPSLMFQRTTYQGKRILYKYMPIINDFRFKDFYKHIDKEEYFVFAEKYLMRVDSTGQQIGNVEQIINTFSDKISDVVQLANGGFALLIYRPVGGAYVHFYDKDAHTTSRMIMPNKVGLLVINTTKDKGLVIGGSHFVVYDSLDQLILDKPFRPGGDTLDMTSIAQAEDGGFYGCGMSWGQFDTRNYDIYAFKTTPEGEIRTGLKENAGRLNVQVMPNPSEGVFRISGEFNNEKVSVSNLLGQVVQELQPLAANGILDVSHLKAGVYILTVTTKDETYVRKITIRK